MTKKRIVKQNFWKKIRFKYRLFFLNENTLEEVFTLRLSGLSAFLIIGLFSFLLIALTSVIIINTPIRNYLPGSNEEIRNEIVSQTLKTDSLEKVIQSQQLYLTNLSLILSGKMSVDSIQSTEHLKQVHPDSVNLEKSPESTTFMKKYEEESRYNLSALPRTSISSGTSFYRPVKGMVSSKYDSETKHYGIDIAADPKESVLATLDGTIVFVGFEASGGYVIQVQHKNGFMSIYKHNAILLKKQGDPVRAGEAIALVGNTGNLSSGTHLHFELWNNGKPVNPEEYIIF